MVDDVVGLFPDAFQPVIWAIFFFALLIAAAAVFYKRMNAIPPPTAGSPIDLRALGVAIQSDLAQKEMAEALTKIAENSSQIRAVYEKDMERDIERWNKLFERMERLENAQLQRPRGRT